MKGLALPPSASAESHQVFKELRLSGLWLIWALALMAGLYGFLSIERAAITQKTLEIARFTDAVVFLEKINDTLTLDSISRTTLPGVLWTRYRDGLLSQGETVLSTMTNNDDFLSGKKRAVLLETSSLFDHFRKEIISSGPVSDLVNTDHRLMVLSTELSGWATNQRTTFFQKIRLLDFERTIIILATTLGGLIYLYQKSRLHRKITRQNRFHQALSRIDQLILTLPDMDHLLPEACQIVVEEGGLLLARFIKMDPLSGEGTVLTHFGNATENFIRRKHSSDPANPEKNPLWTELLEKKQTIVWNQLEEQIKNPSLLQTLRENGILSIAASPVLLDRDMFGALIVYSNQQDYFDPELIKLVDVLTQNITFAIENRRKDDERALREEEVSRLSLFDSLTGLPNRRLFQDRLNQTINRHLRSKGRFGVGILDLDGFKLVNDRLGHQSGDELLVKVSERLRGVLRGTDTLARLGGDEFGIVFSVLEGEKEAAIFDRVIASLALPIPLGKELATVGGSLGITIIPPDEGGDESLIKHADLAMYVVKEHGKNGWEVFQPIMSRSLENAHRMKEELARSFKEKRFSIDYQPQVEMTSGKIEGMEALLRWNHPDRGQMKSEEFIGVLEGCDLIIDVERWVLEEILSHIPIWAKQNICPRVRMNVSSRHLLSGSFIEDLRSAFSHHPDIRPQSLELDVSETRSFQEIRKVKEVFDECRRFGVAITISHIGTDHGSLSYIQTLGIDRVSIDQKFVRKLPKSPQDMAIVASLVTSAQLLLIDVIGEGIETEEEGHLLLKWGCRIGQGFAIAHPMSAENIPEWHRQYQPFESWTKWNKVPWEPKDYPLLMAKEAARVFYENFISGIGIPGETRVEWIDSHRCLQGRWIDGNGALRYGDTKEFREYKEAHESLHEHIRQAISARDREDHPAFEALKSAIREINQDLIRRIDRIWNLDQG